ncbi:exopolysaccharide biosynthesis protein [Salipiger thiooxidans]|nr:exopolysaccharide biosynthesis protein [Salipiger thiooxidans]
MDKAKTSSTRKHRASLSLPIIRSSRNQHRSGALTIGGLLTDLGEASFGWALVLLSLVNLLPLPPGFTLLTALPLLVATAQMFRGYPAVRLPKRFASLPLDHDKLRQTVLRLRPLTRRLERVLHKRYPLVFKRQNQRPLGAALFLISFALFLPLPLSGWLPAISLFVIGVGLVEEDGIVTIAGLSLGLFSVILTGIILFWITLGAEALIH